MSTEVSDPLLWVACLCAQWCDACRAYQPLFASLQTQFPEVRFRWIDIEDEAALVEPLDVENFPTLLIARGGHALFFGTVTPHLETLRRLVQLHLTASPVALDHADAHRLAQHLA